MNKCKDHCVTDVTNLGNFNNVQQCNWENAPLEFSIYKKNMKIFIMVTEMNNEKQEHSNWKKKYYYKNHVYKSSKLRSTGVKEHIAAILDIFRSFTSTCILLKETW